MSLTRDEQEICLRILAESLFAVPNRWDTLELGDCSRGHAYGTGLTPISRNQAAARKRNGYMNALSVPDRSLTPGNLEDLCEHAHIRLKLGLTL